MDSAVLVMNPAAGRVSKGEVMMVAAFIVVEVQRTCERSRIFLC